MSTQAHAIVTHAGGCHCGRVRFEVDAPARLEVADCNCSICAKVGYLHLIVPANRFRLIAGDDSLTTYTFNTHVAQHHFCRHCGVKSFYVPRSHPDGVSVNARCIESATVESMSISPFDGRHWETARATLRDA
ncbi:MAG TPA: GFA family protein [Steroidobacteraceae bacterium]|nr:GFA family protein [Steroidobacteraceae bacterium]